MDILDDWDEINFQKGPFIPDLTLATAIRDDTTRYICEYLNSRDLAKVPSSLRETCVLAGHSVPVGKIARVATPSIYPHLWTVSDPDLKCHYNIDKFLKNSIPLANTLTRLAEETFVKELEGKWTKDVKRMPSHTLDEDSLQLLLLRMNWIRVRDIMYKAQTQKSKMNKMILGINNYRSIQIKDFLFIEIDSIVHVLSYHQVLMIVDTLTSRFLSLEMCKILGKMGLSYLPPAKFLRELYEFGDNILRIHGNNGYKALSTWESICTGIYLKNHEILDISKNYFEGVIKDLDDDIRKVCQQLYKLIDKGHLNANQIFEIFGCYRHFGHPTVDEVAGCKKLKDTTRVKREIDEATCRMAAGGFARGFILNFIQKRGRWPSLEVENGCSNAFKEYVSKRPLNLNEFSAKFDIKDWSYIRFHKEFEFDYFQDFTEILSDKSISPSMNSWTSVYEQSLLSEEWKTLTMENRRVLIDVLKNPEFSIRKIMETIMNDAVPSHWYIVGLHSKEREMKIESRLFAMMVLQMRLYFAVTEANISKNIFPYIPQQTMTMGEPELYNHLMSISKETTCTRQEVSDSTNSPNHSIESPEGKRRRTHRGKRKKKRPKIESVKITGSLDFKKWNWYQSFLANFLVFQMLEDLMGVPNLYNFTHKFFQQSWFYLSSRYCPPKYCKRDADTNKGNSSSKGAKVNDINVLLQEEDECSWFGQYGGCEGLRQKGWTTTTIGLLIALEHITGIRATITGQGDNQVLMIEMPVDKPDCTAAEYLRNHKDEAEKRLQDYFTKLQELVKGMGWELKAAETWFSTSLINYGKEILHKGIFLSGTLKKISRMYPDMSDCYPNLSSRIASLCSTAHASCQKSFTIFPILWLMYFELTLTVQKEIHSGILLGDKLYKICKANKIELDLPFFIFLFSFPKDFGGYPSLNPFGMIYRGHPDPVTNDIEWLKVIRKSVPWVDELLKWAFSGEGFSQKTNYSLLIQDPVSLNFQLPSSPITITRKLLENTVNAFSQNRDIQKLLSFLSGREEEVIIEYLMTTIPLSPRVLNEIYRHTTVGAARAFLNIFVEMRTTKNMMSAQQAHQYLSSIEITELNWFEHIAKIYILVTRCIDKNRSEVLEAQPWFSSCEDFCSTLYIQSIRDRSWKKEIHHVTTPSPHHQSQMVTQEPGRNSDSDPEEYMEYFLLHASIVSDGCVDLNKGVEPPYFGSRTQEKRSSQTLPIQKNDRSLESTKKLARLLDWVCARDSNLGTFIQYVINSRTDLSPEITTLIAGENYGGSIQHRFEDVITKHSASLNSRANFSTRIYFSSDGMGKYGGSGLNYPLHYQGWILHSIAVASNIMACIPGNHMIQFSWKQMPRCTHCLYPLTEVFIDSTEKSVPKVSTAKDCLILYNTSSVIFQGLDLTPLRLGEVVFPDFRKLNNESQKCCAIAWILLGESINVDAPYVVSFSNITVKRHVSSKISQSVFTTVGMSFLLLSFAKIFVSFYLMHALEVVDTYHVSLKHAFRIILHSLSNSLWKSVRPVMLMKGVWSQFLSIKEVTPPSSEVYNRPNHLDSYLYRLISHHIDIIWETKDFEISLFATTSGIDTNRLLKTWAHSLELYSFCSSDLPLESIRKIFGCTWKEIGETEGHKISHTNYLSKLNEVCRRSKNTRIPDFRRRYKFILSGSGAEPWMKAPTHRTYNQDIRDISMAPSTQPTKVQRFFQCAALKNVYDNFFTRQRQNPIKSKLGVSVQTEPVLNKVRKRHDHAYRLTGNYSTAHYKYACLYKVAGIQTCHYSVHLAEGAGGLANFTSRLYHTKIIYYNSLQDLSTFVPQRAHGFTPAALQKLTEEIGTQIHGVHDSLASGGDLLTDEGLNTVKHSLSKLGDPDLITCDAESSGSWSVSEAVELARKVGSLIFDLKASSWVFFKTYNENPTVLARQIQIFLHLSDKVYCVVPAFSSNECYECFLMFKSEPSMHQTIGSGSTTFERLDGENLKTLYALNKKRISPHPYQTCLNRRDILTLHSSMIDLGIGWNLGVALTNLSKGVVIEPQFWSDPFSEITRAISVLYYEIVERVLSFQKVYKNERLGIIELQQRGMSKIESTILLSKSEALLNLQIVMHVLNHLKLPDDLRDKSLRLFHDGEVIFQYDLSYWEWISTYSRDIQKVLGFVHLGMSL
ncbi:RNA-dependent RNA polymerase [Hubei odonate virus 10]|uniref:RNA-directed RNA polymerase L n=1 Tax=Hubei odonate virus 10 TaxID=1922991 RepID=A0A1L3KMU5_9MONO|nr:RNA-dependent RNA polymerase [Hubei odonate virus 10]APG78697.1 RNA-dependent RNA polymerase [Hubei odonate virus 10]